MGPSRVSSTLLDLKVQSAATTVMLNEPVEESPSVLQPQFRLSKWTCLEERKSSSKEVVDGMLLEDRNNSRLRHRGPKHVSGSTSEFTVVDENVRALSLLENFSSTSESTAVNDENKKRSKSLSVFGALVSPKLRDAQVSFETVFLHVWSFLEKMHQWSLWSTIHIKDYSLGHITYFDRHEWSGRLRNICWQPSFRCTPMGN